MSRKCSYCGVGGHERKHCAERLEEKFADSREFDAEGTRKAQLREGETRDDDNTHTDDIVERQLAEADPEDLEEIDEDDDREVRCDGSGEYEVVVPDRDGQIPVECPGCGHTFQEHLTPNLAGSSCPGCKEMIDYVRQSERRDQQDATTDETEQTTLMTDGGTRAQQTRLEVGNTRKPIAVKNARRVTTGDLAALAMCAHRFDPSDVEGWYTHEYDDVLRQWICSNVESVIARLSPHCEKGRGDLPPLHPADDLWVGEIETGPTQTTLEDMEESR